jgi:hypothetical protein
MREGVFCKVSQCVRSATLGRSGVQTQLSQVEVIEYVAAVALDSDLGCSLLFGPFSISSALPGPTDNKIRVSFTVQLLSSISFGLRRNLVAIDIDVSGRGNSGKRSSGPMGVDLDLWSLSNS